MTKPFANFPEFNEFSFSFNRYLTAKIQWIHVRYTKFPCWYLLCPFPLKTRMIWLSFLTRLKKGRNGERKVHHVECIQEEKDEKNCRVGMLCHEVPEAHLHLSQPTETILGYISSWVARERAFVFYVKFLFCVNALKVLFSILMTNKIATSSTDNKTESTMTAKSSLM